ncbi:uncharacterized protein K460DRAFT_408252 [Cucurbitaria berberidis CBS 394.84]|uniref:Uncharacterized protein n=1 Tax=Cucurbitaria berberidis CBS 394.84 TaxID=1168544 RepID=A0A9P4L742_9PLEO|nr:uncharacterized protein K460DRAFT_408252 [Cucurbitaria berberidis CBS 394.84]KAF1843934.1 hypothetical protein K460DRAFT_408252 [Cucurbitaria berberidis CBS 394.84]
MATNAPTLINLPPPPSDVDTPGEAPGTPNSTTTSMSELSTVAIKDGHRGHFPHHRNPADAERADRISRLAGLERVAVSGRTPQGLGPGSAANPPPGYFDANNQPQIFRERSTVGSASATGSVGGRTTWASGSDVYEPDRMSEDQDVETSSMGGFSDEAVSLVGFGEGARTPARQHSQIGSPAIGKGAVPGHLREQLPASPMTGVSAPSSSGTTQTTSSIEQQKNDARVIDGMTYDDNIIDTANQTPPVSTQGRDGDSTSEQAIRERMRQRQAGPDVMDYEQQK